MQGHPNARSYRTKCLPDYNDLGLIFGDAVSNKIQNELRLDKDLEDENVVAKAGMLFLSMFKLVFSCLFICFLIGNFGPKYGE